MLFPWMLVAADPTGLSRGGISRKLDRALQSVGDGACTHWGCDGQGEAATPIDLIICLFWEGLLSSFSLFLLGWIDPKSCERPSKNTGDKCGINLFLWEPRN